MAESILIMRNWINYSVHLVFRFQILGFKVTVSFLRSPWIRTCLIIYFKYVQSFCLIFGEKTFVSMKLLQVIVLQFGHEFRYSCQTNLESQDDMYKLVHMHYHY